MSKTKTCPFCGADLTGMSLEDEPETVEIHGKKYKAVPEKHDNSCAGCVAKNSLLLCVKITKEITECTGKIWKEVK